MLRKVFQDFGKEATKNHWFLLVGFCYYTRDVSSEFQFIVYGNVIVYVDVIVYVEIYCLWFQKTVEDVKENHGHQIGWQVAHT